MRDRLAHAIQLREKGRAKQDQSILEKAQTLLLELVGAYPMMPRSTFRSPWCMTIWDWNESPLLSTYEHWPKDSPDQILNDACWAWVALIGYWANTRKRRKHYVEGPKNFLTTGLSRSFLQ